MDKVADNLTEVIFQCRFGLDFDNRRIFFRYAGRRVLGAQRSGNKKSKGGDSGSRQKFSYSNPPAFWRETNCPVFRALATLAFHQSERRQGNEIKYKRNTEIFFGQNHPRINPPSGEGALGIAMDEIGTVKLPIYRAVIEGRK